MNSREAIDYAIKAKVAVITHRGNNNNADLPFYAFSHKTKIIQLWHGIPLKKIGYDDNIFSFSANEKSFAYKYKEFKKNLLYPYNKHLHKPEMIFISFGRNKKLISSAFRTNESKVVITGYPRNDIILNNVEAKNQSDKKKIDTYAPTFRGKIGTNFDLFLDYGFDILKLGSVFRKKTSTLLYQITSFQ